MKPLKTALSLVGAIFAAAIASALLFHFLSVLGMYSRGARVLTLSFIVLAVIPVFRRLEIPVPLLILAAALIPPLYLVDERLHVVASVLVGLIASRSSKF
ncbi:hypothetical protein [Archaeoglobus neptunius]|uniref:hypothetical protein n=1 Tax=Archaeoglobus neptunius TaxID=2798580 RepID=UPI001928377A|nr:hypothetical protein [Archaeoglobus neptunius]